MKHGLGTCLAWLAATCVAAAAASAALVTELADPAGDDDGPGTYVYPTDKVYLPGSFDLLGLAVVDQGANIEFRLTVRAALENPWEMDAGFSLQMAQIYIDQDGAAGSGHERALPGMNATFRPEAAWEKCVLVTPQPAARVRSEIETKAAWAAGAVLVPLKVTARGRTLVALVPRAALGAPSPDWGYQVLLSSNEGFPDPDEILSRRVNEYEGPHRFGGGDDWEGDPHFMDILVPPGRGGPEEAARQHEILADHASGPEPAADRLVRLPMVRSGVDDPSPARPPSSVAAGSGQLTSLDEPPPAASAAQTTGLRWSGKIYTNWLYGNDNTSFSAYVAPFGDGGHNGTNSELELVANANVSEYVEAYARIKNRFRKNYWSTYWDNQGETTGAGETNEANQYMKLRGVWVRLRSPLWLRPAIESALIGSSDLGAYSPWTIGRIRYIDRDNAMGLFASGRPAAWLSYEAGRISLPSRWAGPGYTTRGAGFDPAEGFHTRDFAYALAANFGPWTRGGFRLAGDVTVDREGNPSDETARDGVSLIERYETRNASLEADLLPLEALSLRGVLAYSETEYRDRKDYIHDWLGVNSVIQKDTADMAFTLTAEASDPFGIGLSLQAQYFDIGADYQALMGARREADVLITEGFEGDDAGGAFDWGGWWGNMVQVPTLLPDNNETQFDETYAQSCIGWRGFTGTLAYGFGAFDLAAEYTAIDYNTDAQDRDMSVYPTNGPGRDYDSYWYSPAHTWADSVYRANQERATRIWLMRGGAAFDLGREIDLGFKVKSILDEDERDRTLPLDDYRYDKMIYDMHAGCQVTAETYVRIGYTLFDKDMGVYYEALEERFEWNSTKHRTYLEVRYSLGGAKLGYMLENYRGRDLDPHDGEVHDDYDLWRSRAFLEVAF